MASSAVSSVGAESRIPLKVIGNQDGNISYQERQAVRAVMYEETSGDVALIYIAKGSYYKLPGGGIELTEDHRVAVDREILEETGCTIVKESAQLLATSEEWRNDLHQVSFCYAAKLAVDTGKPELTELEASEGLSHSWHPLNIALELMQQARPTSELGCYIQERDLFFLNIFAGQRQH